MKTLVMTFQTQGGTKVRYRVADPKDAIEAADVQAAMQAILARNVFITSSGDLASIVGAELIDEQTTKLI